MNNQVIREKGPIRVVNEIVSAGYLAETKETALYIYGSRCAAGAGWNCHHIIREYNRIVEEIKS